MRPVRSTHISVKLSMRKGSETMTSSQIGELIWQQIKEYHSKKDYYMSEWRVCRNEQDSKMLWTAARSAEKLEHQYCKLYREYIRIFHLGGDDDD